jgi:4'-phosphopantetheinyl transferase
VSAGLQTFLSVVIDARDGEPRVTANTHEIEAVTARARAVLSAFEQARCARVILAPARMLRTAAHVLKRETLAATLGVAPRDVPLIEPADRPLLAAPHDGLHVSLSHTRGAVAIAFGPGPIGVDIEALGRSNDAVALAQRYFAPGEADAVRDDATGLQFAWRWTAKEALKKAADINLFEALARAMPSDAQDSFEAHGARFDVMRPADGYVCTLARMQAH